jgi:hypothetical protein
LDFANYKLYCLGVSPVKNNNEKGNYDDKGDEKDAGFKTNQRGQGT